MNSLMISIEVIRLTLFLICILINSFHPQISYSPASAVSSHCNTPTPAGSPIITPITVSQMFCEINSLPMVLFRNPSTFSVASSRERST